MQILPFVAGLTGYPELLNWPALPRKDLGCQPRPGLPQLQCRGPAHSPFPSGRWQPMARATASQALSQSLPEKGPQTPPSGGWPSGQRGGGSRRRQQASQVSLRHLAGPTACASYALRTWPQISLRTRPSHRPLGPARLVCLSCQRAAPCCPVLGGLPSSETLPAVFRMTFIRVPAFAKHLHHFCHIHMPHTIS